MAECLMLIVAYALPALFVLAVTFADIDRNIRVIPYQLHIGLAGFSVFPFINVVLAIFLAVVITRNSMKEKK